VVGEVNKLAGDLILDVGTYAPAFGERLAGDLDDRRR
jgi:hypothetical protein